MTLTKINKYTWVIGNKKQATTTPAVQSQPQNTSCKRMATFTNYKKFCKEVFSQRKFICKREFNKKIQEKIKPNTTWYRNRFQSLGLIKEENNVIKPGEKL